LWLLFQAAHVSRASCSLASISSLFALGTIKVFSIIQLFRFMLLRSWSQQLECGKPPKRASPFPDSYVPQSLQVTLNVASNTTGATDLGWLFGKKSKIPRK